MSMLSAQCDELRAMAESVGLEVPQAATLMMDAADTIWELRNKCADLVSEREHLFQSNVEKNNEMLRLVGENAKLRELAALMHGVIKDLQDTFGVSVVVGGVEMTAEYFEAEYMRELRIEAKQ